MSRADLQHRAEWEGVPVTVVATRRRRSLLTVVALLLAGMVGLTVAAGPAWAAYKPVVYLTKYTVHRGGFDSATARHFVPNHVGWVSTLQNGHRIFIRKFHTGPKGNTSFGFRLPFKVKPGRHWLRFKTNHKTAGRWITVRR
jgi:hypothetical protein